MTARGEARRQALLEAARRLLVNEGAGALSLRGVASACGIRLGHLQHFFPTHASLVEAVLAQIFSESEAAIAAALEGVAAEPSMARRLGAGVDVLLWQQTDPALASTFYELWALARRDEAVRTTLHQFYATWAERVAQVVASPQLAVPLKVRRTRAKLFVACLEGISLMRSGTIGQADRPFDEAARTMLLSVLLGPVTLQGASVE